MPCGQQVQVVLVEIRDRLRVVHRQFLVGDVVDPSAHDLAHELAARLAADGLGDNADRVLRLDEAEWHRDSREVENKLTGRDCRRPCGRHFSTAPETVTTRAPRRATGACSQSQRVAGPLERVVVAGLAAGIPAVARSGASQLASARSSVSTGTDDRLGERRRAALQEQWIADAEQALGGERGEVLRGAAPRAPARCSESGRSSYRPRRPSVTSRS